VLTLWYAVRVEEPQPIAEPIEQALVKILRPDLLDGYLAEKERHREEMKAIETARKRARAWLKRLFGPVRARKEEELEAEHLERVQGEDDRHARFMEELRETIRDHVNPDRQEPPAA
jgi:hypothetical protein